MPFHFLPQDSVFSLDLEVLIDPHNFGNDIFVDEGLQDIIECPVTQGIHGVLNRGIGRNHDNNRFRRDIGYLPEEVYAVHSWHLYVNYGYVYILLSHQGQGLLPVWSRENFISDIPNSIS
jgi:hypothetical protein